MEAVLRRVPQGFLSTGLADSAVIRRAWLVAALSAAVFAVTVPFAAIPIGAVPSFVPIYVSALVFCDLITAVLLFSQFAVLRSWSLLVLAGGYLFTCLATAGYLLIFPGIFGASGLFGAGPQTSSALYMFWHAGFPLFVLGYSQIRRREVAGTLGPSRRRSWVSVGGLATAVALVVVVFEIFATAGQGVLPEFLLSNKTTLLGHFFLLGVWALNLAALLFLWIRRTHTMLDVWLLVVMAVWLCDLGLSAILNSGRYDLGWYVGRINGLAAAGFLLVLLLVENGQSYSRLFRLSVELEHANTTLEHLSLQDALTGLANRRSFDRTLEEQIAVTQRHGRTFVLLLCDIDHFKAYNDLYGHQAGDEALKRVAATLQSCCRRPGDFAARYGGEEFALILPDTEAASAQSIAELAREAVLSQNIAHARSSVAPVVSISIGAAPFSLGGTMNAAELITMADRALYAAKHAGRNRVEMMES